jgi:hypothetical protein
MRLTQCVTVVAGASNGDGGETASGGAGGASAGAAGALDCPCHAWPGGADGLAASGSREPCTQKLARKRELQA